MLLAGTCGQPGNYGLAPVSQQAGVRNVVQVLPGQRVVKRASKEQAPGRRHFYKAILRGSCLADF